MTAIINAAPRAILRGVQDLSGRSPVYEPEALPQHLPHIFLYTERGTGVPQITIGDGLNKLYGAKSFDLRLKAGEGGYATHQTLLATVLSQNANQMMIQRLIPTDAKTARFRLSVDVLDEAAPITTRASDGSIVLNTDVNDVDYGKPVPLPSVNLGNWDLTVSGGDYPDATGVPTTAPVAPVEGNVWNDLTAGKIKYYRSGSWVVAGANGSGMSTDTVPVSTGLTIAGDYWTLINAGTALTGDKIRAHTNNPGTSAGVNWIGNVGTITTKSLAWVVDAIEDDISNNTTFGAGVVAPGRRAGSSLIPIMDFEVASAGKWGNGAGVRLSAPNINSAIPFDTRLVQEQLTTMFRMSVVEKENEITAPKIIETRFSEQFIDFSLKPSAVNERTSQEIYLSSIFKDSYSDTTTSPPTFGTFSDIHVYEDNIASLLADLYFNERKVLAIDMNWDDSNVDDLLPNPSGLGNYHYIFTGDTALTGATPLIDAGGDLTGKTDAVINLTGQTNTAENGYYRYSVNTAGTAYTLTPVELEADGRYTVNFFTAVGWNAYPYESIRMVSDKTLTALSGTSLKSTVTQYALGGNDGTITYDNFNLQVAQQCANYGDMIVKRNPLGDADPSDVPLDFMDTAKWPQSAIWDTGFGMSVAIPGGGTKNVKADLLVPIGRRKDIWVALSTQEIGPGAVQNTAAQESSIAITLQNMARMYPESEYYGTKTCRAIVVGHSGELSSSTWRGLAPMTIDLAAKVASYMGASNGAWIPGKNFDISPKNMVTMFKTDTINAAFKNADVRNEDWANGLIWVQNFDRRSLFYPGIQTVYDDDTSVLNSLFNIIAVCELEKVCERVWRELTGIQTLTVAQFIERSDNLITQKVANRFDDKFIIVPETYLTEGDEQRGFSWSCKVNMYAANMRTVGTYTIVSRRIEDYQP